jgi:phage/plasmid-associated DNA primase
MTFAFWRRWLVLKFPNKFQKVEGFYENNFTEEVIENIIPVSLLAFRNVLLSGRFSFEESDVDYKNVWLRNSDSVYAFLDDAQKNNIIKREQNSKELTDEIYVLYQNYCEDEEREPITKTMFTQRMEMYGFPLIKSGGKKYYKGIKIVREKETPSSLASLAELGQPKSEEMPKKSKLQTLGELIKTYGKQTLPLPLLKERFSDEEINKMSEDGDIALLSDDKVLIMRWEE